MSSITFDNALLEDMPYLRRVSYFSRAKTPGALVNRLRTLLLLALAALPLAAAAKEKMQWEIDREFKKVERRLAGSDAQIKDGCGPALERIADRPIVLERSLELQRSDVTMRARNTSGLRPCARAVANAGVVEGWRATQGSSGDLSLTVVLLRARRDPHLVGVERTEATDKQAAKAMASIWEDRNPAYESLGAEVLAPDLVDLYEARWNAGNLSFEGRSPDDRLADGYKRLVTAVVTSTAGKIQWAVSADAPPQAMPELPQRGLLRGTWRVAPAGAVLRLFAEMDRRDFVVPSAGALRGGGLGGGWAGVSEGIAKSLGRERLHAGQVDVFAPSGVRQPPRRAWDGTRITFQLESVPSNALWTLFSVAGKVTVEGPDDLPLTDVHVKNVPWDQVLDAIALAHGCTTTATDATHRAVECSSASLTGVPPPPPQPPLPLPADDRGPLTRVPASKLRVIAFGVRDTGKSWRAIVRTPAGLHVLVRTGSPIGVDGALAVVDEHGVSVVLERERADGAIVRTAVPLPF